MKYGNTDSGRWVGLGMLGAAIPIPILAVKAIPEQHQSFAEGKTPPTERGLHLKLFLILMNVLRHFPGLAKYRKMDSMRLYKVFKHTQQMSSMVACLRTVFGPPLHLCIDPVVLVGDQLHLTPRRNGERGVNQSDIHRLCAW